VEHQEFVTRGRYHLCFYQSQGRGLAAHLEKGGKKIMTTGERKRGGTSPLDSNQDRGAGSRVSRELEFWGKRWGSKTMGGL